METYGFELSVYYAHAYHQQESSVRTPITGNRKNKFIYSFSYFGQEFFKWLFSQTEEKTEIVKDNKITFGILVNSNEEHHFTILTEDNNAIVLSTYKGADQMFINDVKIDKLNSLLKQKEGDTDSYEDLFNIVPRYSEYKLIEEKCFLFETDYKLPTFEEFIAKIDTIIDKLCYYNEKDSEFLSIIKNKIENYQ